MQAVEHHTDAPLLKVDIQGRGGFDVGRKRSHVALLFPTLAATHFQSLSPQTGRYVNMQPRKINSLTTRFLCYIAGLGPLVRERERLYL